mmetsp:Transcript_772/g.1284  ORF Transcript_772/g.1284 Transcript_772/m.1284 type:complete len:524 (-) Transcript_772:308-1879(-)|eukprot:CAMPEP_0185033000 /NCGR_PEP_ID=MMETSP1103-20130426/21595_1 /TAXON_ID=36769 /ORGANISM="Paraphysomonas bandaiensis, Strain Caron Lab Isolate" /LENGTH=523 /DNA_ID=CAMNT_0027569119 /DNA_START=121 /DNA_END=1692 /DNA_ORIENTATION=+
MSQSTYNTSRHMTNSRKSYQTRVVDITFDSKDSCRSPVVHKEDIEADQSSVNGMKYALERSSNKIAKEILEEQEEIWEHLENSSFLTNIIRRSSLKRGLSEQQLFARLVEEVERAKQRLQLRPEHSTQCLVPHESNRMEACSESDDYSDDYSEDSLEEDVGDDGMIEYSSSSLRPTGEDCFGGSVKDEVFGMMSTLLEHDEEGEDSHEDSDSSGHIQALLADAHRRSPSRLPRQHQSQPIPQGRLYSDIIGPPSTGGSSMDFSCLHSGGSLYSCGKGAEGFSSVPEEDSYEGSVKTMTLSPLACMCRGGLNEWLLMSLRSHCANSEREEDFQRWADAYWQYFDYAEVLQRDIGSYLSAGGAGMDGKHYRSVAVCVTSDVLHRASTNHLRSKGHSRKNKQRREDKQSCANKGRERRAEAKQLLVSRSVQLEKSEAAEEKGLLRRRSVGSAAEMRNESKGGIENMQEVRGCPAGSDVLDTAISRSNILVLAAAMRLGHIAGEILVDKVMNCDPADLDLPSLRNQI